MVRKKGEKAIREILKQRNPSLYTKLNEIWPEVQKDIYDQEVSKARSIDGFLHCIKVEENLNLLINDDVKAQMTDEQLFMLFAAACLRCHAANCLKKPDNGKLLKQEVYKKARDYNFSESLAHIISRITGFQTREDIEKLPSSITLETGIEVENIPLLAAILKLATVLPKIDLTVPQETAELETSEENEEFKLRFWQRYKAWEFSPENENCILYQFIPEREENYNFILTGMESERKKIMDITAILKANNYPNQILPTINEDKIIKKLMEQRAGKLDIGMNYYKKSEFDIFRGRNEEIKKLKALIQENPICLLTSECGRGKSSLINAGLLPSLRREGWRFAYVRPEPKRKILNQLIIQMLPEAVGKISSMKEFLHRITDKYFHTNIIIALDQFECLVDPTFSSEQPEEFIKELAVVNQFPYIRFLIAYRSDFEGKLRYFWNEIADDPRGLPTFPLGPLNKSDTAEALRFFFEANKINIADADVLQIIAEDLFKESKKITRGRGVFPPFIQMVAEALRNYVRDTKQSLTYKIYDQEMDRAYSIIGFYLKAMIRQVKQDTYIGRTVLYCLVNQMGEQEYRYLIAGKSYE